MQKKPRLNLHTKQQIKHKVFVKNKTTLLGNAKMKIYGLKVKFSSKRPFRL